MKPGQMMKMNEGNHYRHSADSGHFGPFLRHMAQKKMAGGLA